MFRILYKSAHGPGASARADRRPPGKAALGCEALEGRRLLNAGGMGSPGPMPMPYLGLVAAVEHPGLNHAHDGQAGHDPGALGGAPVGDLATPGFLGTNLPRPGRFDHHGGPNANPTAPTAAQQQAMQTLGDELKTIQTKLDSSATQPQTTALQADLQAISQVAGRPSAQASRQLQTDLQTIFQGGAFTDADLATLKSDVTGVLQSANVPQANITQALADSQAILDTSGVTTADLNTLISDLKAVQAAGGPTFGGPGGFDHHGPGGIGHHGGPVGGPRGPMSPWKPSGHHSAY